MVLMTVMSSVCAEDQSRLDYAPPFAAVNSEQWINTAPLDLAQLRGKVLLLNVWTFDCINCKRSIPWLKKIYADYQHRGFEIIGVHSPEYEWEKSRSAVLESVRQHDIDWPVMLDDDHSYWKSLHNKYWPAFYLVDKQGRIVGKFIGETHAGDYQAVFVEQLIDKLLLRK